MQVDLHKEVAEASQAVAEAIGQLYAQATSSVSTVGLGVSNPLSGRARVLVAAEYEPWEPKQSRILGIYDFTVPPRSVCDLTDYWFGHLEPDEDGRVGVDVVTATGAVRNVDLEHEDELEDCLLDFLEVVATSNVVAEALRVSELGIEPARFLVLSHDAVSRRVLRTPQANA